MARCGGDAIWIINDRWALTAGYRTVEVGADTDDVYSFGWFQRAVVSGIYRF